MKEKAVWMPVEVPNRLESRLESLRQSLGKEADVATFIARGNKALHFYEALTKLKRISEPAAAYNAQLARVARCAQALASAIEELAAAPESILMAQQHRRPRHLSISKIQAFRDLADDASACQIPTREGAPKNNALILLTRDIAAAYEAACGRRASNYENGPFHRVLLTVFEIAGIDAENLGPIYRRAFPEGHQNPNQTVAPSESSAPASESPAPPDEPTAHPRELSAPPREPPLRDTLRTDRATYRATE